MTLAGIAARNLLRNKFRSLLTIFGVAATIGTFVLLRTALAVWSEAAENVVTDRVVTRHKVTFILPLPIRYVQEVRQAPGVREATFETWFGAKDPLHPGNENFFANIAVDGDTFFKVHDDIIVSPADLERWQNDRRGAIVGDLLAKRFGWKVGQTVTLTGTIYPGDWQFTIDGIYTVRSKSRDRLSFFFHWKYLNESLTGRRRDQVGLIVSRVHNPAQSTAISQGIDKIFDVREDQTLSQNERAYGASRLAMFSSILAAMDVVSIIILGIMMLIMGNTIAMGARERTSEYGVMRAIGFRPHHIALLVVAEAIATGVLGGGLALLGAQSSINGWLGRGIEENFGQFFPSFRMSSSVAGLALFLSVALGAVAGLLPAYRTFKLNVVEALRRVA